MSKPNNEERERRVRQVLEQFRRAGMPFSNLEVCEKAGVDPSFVRYRPELRAEIRTAAQLANGRATAVSRLTRQNPEYVAELLREMGYEVTPPNG